jgi:predicted phosphodiesterase
MTYATPEHMNYVFNSLDKESLRFIKSMPTNIKINYKGANIFFTHYIHDKNGVIRDDYEEFTEPRLRKLFEYTGCNVVFFGHVHKRKILINEEGESYVCHGASGCVKGNRTFYTTFDIHKDFDSANFDIDRVNVTFNRKKFDEKMRAAALPDKENYAPFVFGLDLKNEKPQTGNNGKDDKVKTKPM